MNIYLKIWCLLMLLCCAAVKVICYLIGCRKRNIRIIRIMNILLVVILLTAVFLSFSSAYFSSAWLKVIFGFCLAASPAAIALLWYVVMMYQAQFHVKIKEAVYVDEADYKKIVPGEKTTVYETKDLYIFFPEYRTVNFNTKNLPKKSDRSVTWCGGAAYQHEFQLRFSPGNIEGSYASLGQYHEGAPMPPYKKGAFVFYDGHFVFDFDDPEKAVKTAAEHGGDGFMQGAMIVDGQPVPLKILVCRKKCFRVLAELNGSLCIINAKKRTSLIDYSAMLTELGVSSALYLDMGGGFNYSWYRRENGRVRMLFKLRFPWAKNWLTFRK